MTLPNSYTAEEFAGYLASLVGQAGLATLTGWTVPDSYAEIVNDTLILLKVDDLETFTGRTGIAKLRAAGRVVLWRAVLASLTTAYDFSDSAVGGSGSWSRSQIVKNVQTLLGMAEADATKLGVDVSAMPPARVVTVVYPNDPYRPGGILDPSYWRSRGSR